MITWWRITGNFRSMLQQNVNVSVWHHWFQSILWKATSYQINWGSRWLTQTLVTKPHKQRSHEICWFCSRHILCSCGFKFELATCNWSETGISFNTSCLESSEQITFSSEHTSEIANKLLNRLNVLDARIVRQPRNVPTSRVLAVRIYFPNHLDFSAV